MIQLWTFAYLWLLNKPYENEVTLKLGLAADPVIKAIARLEFEDGLRTGVLPGGCWDP